MENETIGMVVHATGSTGVLHQLTGVIARHRGDITSVEILDNRPEQARTYFEVVLPAGPDGLMEDLRGLPIDPMTGKSDWELRSAYDSHDAGSWGGENVFDVRSKSKETALNGEKYSDW